MNSILTIKYENKKEGFAKSFVVQSRAEAIKQGLKYLHEQMAVENGKNYGEKDNQSI